MSFGATPVNLVTQCLIKCASLLVVGYILQSSKPDNNLQLSLHSTPGPLPPAFSPVEPLAPDSHGGGWMWRCECQAVSWEVF